MATDSLLLKNIDFVTPEGVKKGDVFIKEGRIQQIGPSLNVSAEVTINESGLTALPGIIDPHVHFRDPGVTDKEDLYTGPKAAASGGITSFFEMPNTRPSTTSIQAMTEKKEIAANKSIINYNFFIGATHDNVEACHEVKNVPGIKIFVGSSTGSLLVDKQEELEAFFSRSNRLIAVHSEDETMVQENMSKFKHSTDVKDHLNIRTTEAAITSTKRLVALAKKFQRRLHICHLTTADEVAFLKSENLAPLVTTEVTPQHLFTYAPNIYDDWGTFAQINPPIREKHHQEALWAGLLDGTIHMIGTDHAPHLIEEKETPFGTAPSGMPGVETSLPLLLNMVDKGQVSLLQVVKWMSENVAKYYKIKNKGKIEVGYDADIVLVDLKQSKKVNPNTFHSKAKWSVFENQALTGWPLVTIVNGQIVYREGDFFEEIKGKEVQIDE